jgi:hypothetical protein
MEIIKAGKYVIKIEARLADEPVRTPYDATEELLSDIRIALSDAISAYRRVGMHAVADYYHKLWSEFRTGKEA